MLTSKFLVVFNNGEILRNWLNQDHFYQKEALNNTVNTHNKIRHTYYTTLPKSDQKLILHLLNNHQSFTLTISSYYFFKQAPLDFASSSLYLEKILENLKLGSNWNAVLAVDTFILRKWKNVKNNESIPILIVSEWKTY